MHTMTGMTVLRYSAFSIPNLQCSGWSGSARLSLAALPYTLGPSLLVIRLLARAAATPLARRLLGWSHKQMIGLNIPCGIRRHARVHHVAQQIKVLCPLAQTSADPVRASGRVWTL